MTDALETPITLGSKVMLIETFHKAKDLTAGEVSKIGEKRITIKGYDYGEFIRDPEKVIVIDDTLYQKFLDTIEEEEDDE